MGSVKLWSWRVFTLGIVCGITATIACGAVAAFVFYYLYIFPLGERKCVNDSRFVSHNDAGDIIELKESLCGGISNTDTVYVIVKIKETNKSAIIFSYESLDAEPHFEWYGNDVLKIRIGSVAEVHSKLDHFSSLKIQYDIGNIIYP